MQGVIKIYSSSIHMQVDGKKALWVDDNSPPPRVLGKNKVFVMDI
jgi:hypothetical protein